MQRVFSLMRVVTPRILNTTETLTDTAYRCFSNLQNNNLKSSLLSATTPYVNQVCGFKVRGRLIKRCKACYFVIRDERLYVICPKFPRHKQMAMVPKPLNTYILTHASQSPIRPW